MGPTLKLEMPAERKKDFRTLNEKSYVGTEWLAASAQPHWLVLLHRPLRHRDGQEENRVHLQSG